eukprot:2018573-Ditylum_brightwellii.AAC.1
MPLSVEQVFKQDYQLHNDKIKRDDIREKRVVCKEIYPVIQLLYFEDKKSKEETFNTISSDVLTDPDDKKFQQMNPCAYHFNKGMGWRDADVPYIDQAIYWNSFKKIVQATISSHQSSDISLVKRIIVPGEKIP